VYEAEDSGIARLSFSSASEGFYVTGGDSVASKGIFTFNNLKL
jgi:hypothetical protein